MLTSLAVSLMDLHHQSFEITNNGRGTTDITQRVQAIVGTTKVEFGLCYIFVHHTSASVILCENADPTVRADLERFAAKFAADGDLMFQHIDEGHDDMPAHIRTIFTQTSLSIPIVDGSCDLGTWQGIYLWEHRMASHRRRITISVLGS